MSSTFLARGSALMIATALAVAVLAGQASAQCLISGPTTMCSGGSAQLCGDPGPYDYEWTGPNGFTANTQCIFATVPGTYSLRVFDQDNGMWFGPCTQTVTEIPLPSSSISGPTAGCAGSSVQLCGPAGNFMYQWTGPNGFTAFSSCVNVSQSGTYSLVVRDASTGCESQPASHTVTFTSGPASSISGPTTGCAGSTVQLCGPVGNFTYQWTGPNGFGASTSCVNVSQSGVYSLVVSDATTGCAGAPTTQTVTFTAGPASSISGPTTGCAGSSVQLCGPSGNLTYRWTGPNGFSASTSCVSVSQSGVYSLVVSDATTGCAGAPTTQTVSFVSGPASSISGPTSGCDGTPLQLCGPSGNLTYLWSGPNGFAATTSCVNVTLAGVYGLVVTDATTGCAGAPASQTVTFGPCRALSDNCPRTASFWARQCSPRDPSLFPFTPAQVASIASCVDDRSNALNWSGATTFCRTVRWTPPCDVRKRAKRQFAGVLANVCAEALHLDPHSGQYVGLDPATPLNLTGVSTTIGDWITAADAKLVELEPRSLNDHQVRSAYRDIIRVGWNINHGVGIGPVCPGGTGSMVAGVEPVSGADDDFAVDPDDASLIVATTDDAIPSLVFERPWPNPFSNSSRIAYTVSDAGAQDVVIVVHDLSGRAVRDLVRDHQGPGRYEVQWDGRANDGSPVHNGVYFVSGRVGNQPVQSRVTLLR